MNNNNNNNVIDIASTISLEERFKKKTGLIFSEFYASYKPKLIWHLSRYTKNKEIAQDFADDAFTLSLLKIENYNNEKSQIHTWIYKIGENLVKKDYKDRLKMNVTSLDKENADNLNLINLIPNGSCEEILIKENDNVLNKKAEIIKDAINNLPEKYKRVMVLRELENKPYTDIAEICEKEMCFELTETIQNLPYVNDFKELNIENTSDVISYINITYIENNEYTIQFEIEPFKTFILCNTDIKNIINLEVVVKKSVSINYKTATNLSTIKSQIGKGRQLIQSMVKNQFKLLDDQGLY